MALIKTIEEVKQYCSIIDLNMSIDSLNSYLRKAEPFIKECLGTDTYTALTTAYNADNLSEAQQVLLPYVQDPLVNIALWLWIAGGQLKVGDKGVQLDHSGDSKTAFQWQIDGWKDDLDAAGFNGLDILLQFLEDNKTDYTDWANDESAYTINKTFFNADAISFGKVMAINNSRRTFKALAPYMEMAHDMELKPLLGDDFYDEIKAAISAVSLTPEQKLLLPILKKIEVYFAMAKAYGPLRFVITSNGIRLHETLNTKDNEDLKKSATDIEAGNNALRMEEYGRFYQNLLIKLLNDNADNYPTWKNSSKYVDPNATKVSSTYVGDGWLGL